MSTHAIPAASHDDPGPHDADKQDYRQFLHDLIGMGADVARCLHGQAIAQAAQAVAPHPAQQTQHAMDAQPAPASKALISLALAFDRIARAVRRSILLARSLAKPVQPVPDPAQHRAAARRRIIREVEDAIQRPDNSASDGRDSAETLQAELRERLDAPDLNDDISTRPPAHIITEICRDLGIAAMPGTRPWKRRTPEDIAQLCAEAVAPSGTRPPGAYPPGTGSQAPRLGAALPIPDPKPDPAALPRIEPGPIHPGRSLPEDPADVIAMILRHSATVHGRCRPPPRT